PVTWRDRRALFRRRRLLEADARELVAELLDAAAQAVDALLRAGVERMGLAGGFQLEQRQLAAVFHVDHFLAGGARARHELEAVRQVHEADFAVVGVNAVFHGGALYLALPVGSHVGTMPSTFRKRKTLDYSVAPGGL